MQDGILAYTTARSELGLHLAPLVAKLALWVSPEDYKEKLPAGEMSWAVNSTFRRKRAKEIDGPGLDDNTKANYALKSALGKGPFKNYMVCHVWEKSCYDTRYHTCLANLVLIPAPLAGLSDHDPEIIACLKYRAYELYGFVPEGKPRPERPDNYPIDWHAPIPHPKRKPNKKQVTEAHLPIKLQPPSAAQAHPEITNIPMTLNQALNFFRTWLHHRYPTGKTAKSRAGNIKTISDHYPELLDLIQVDLPRKQLVAAFVYSKHDVDDRRPVRHRISIDGDQYDGTATYRATLKLFIEWWDTEGIQLPR